jgi:hypothetical protein
MMKITFVDGDDWEALYIDGECVTQGHRIEARELAEILSKRFGFEWDSGEADQEWLEDRGSFPKFLDQVLFEDDEDE